MKKILDYGCGTGYRSEVLGLNNDYFGADIDPENITGAKERYTGLDFRRVDGVTLPYEDSFFDEVHAYDVLEHVEKLEKLFGELARCLKPGGKMIIEVPEKTSEERLIAIHPKYWDEIGHVRFVTNDVMVSLANGSKSALNIKRKSRKKGIENILLAHFYRKGGYILKETGNFSNANQLLIRLSLLFSEDFFQTGLFRKMWPVWILFPVWIVTVPVGHILSILSPKTIRYELIKTGE